VLIKEYLENNPSHKLFFKKKFENLIGTDLYKYILDFFKLLNFKKTIN
jgi:hypothetical protein